MAATARIDELRSKFDDNPKRYFAPLANEYRKAGDLGTAIAICRTQLRQFPSHMSGHVVLGQALYEAGELDEARQVFVRAVDLDPENLIALRHLGDIARARGDGDSATLWYRRVLDADPSNEQVAALLAELAHPPAELEVFAPPQAAESAPAPEPAPESGPEPAPEPAVEQRPAFADLTPVDLTWAPPAARAAAAEPPAPTAPVETETFEFLDDWMAAPDAAREPVEAASEPASRPDADRGLDPAIADDLFDPVVGLDLPPAESETVVPAAEPAPLAEPPIEPDEAAGRELVTSPAFATETMAELCLEQGHEAEALAIFERLLAHRPGDAPLAARVEALRARVHVAAEPSAGQFLRDLAERQPATDAPVVAPVAEPAAPAPSERDEWAARALGDAFRPVPDAPSLYDDVLALGSAAPRAADDVDLSADLAADLSFDRFFVGLEPAEAAPAAVAEPRATGPADWRDETPPMGIPALPTHPDPEPASDDDDLAEFNAWLRGLRDS